MYGVTFYGAGDRILDLGHTRQMPPQPPLPFVFEAVSHCVVQASSLTLLSPLPESWDYRCAPLCLGLGESYSWSDSAKQRKDGVMEEEKEREERKEEGKALISSIVFVAEADNFCSDTVHTTSLVPLRMELGRDVHSVRSIHEQGRPAERIPSVDLPVIISFPTCPFEST